ncbi:MAG: histidinol-phosphatase HisJ family protein [Ruminococcaceae bacterium]|nr:histidinol-phosphatase HisJ family protein [Oscillospiraceae bacterium]
MISVLFDCHTHTVHSDGKNTVSEMCMSAIEKGISGLTITDHADMNFYMERNTFRRIAASMESTAKAQESFGQNLKVLKGIELGEYTIAPRKAEEVLSIGGFDAVLCSVHFVPKAGWSLAYNRIDFQNCMTSAEELNEYIGLYFDLLDETVDAFDFDILAHIHCPVRYISGKWGRKSDIMIFEDKICRILEKIIKRNIALELNTVYLKDGEGQYNFSLDKILSLYKCLGGNMVTLGSDAHNRNNVARNFTEAAVLLKTCGFDSVYYFEDRIPKKIMI